MGSIFGDWLRQFFILFVCFGIFNFGIYDNEGAHTVSPLGWLHGKHEIPVKVHVTSRALNFRRSKAGVS